MPRSFKSAAPLATDLALAIASASVVCVLGHVGGLRPSQDKPGLDLVCEAISRRNASVDAQRLQLMRALGALGAVCASGSDEGSKHAELLFEMVAASYLALVHQDAPSLHEAALCARAAGAQLPLLAVLFVDNEQRLLDEDPDVVLSELAVAAELAGV